MREQFIYAVARIRAKELSLLSAQDVSRLMSCETFEECINICATKAGAAKLLMSPIIRLC